MENYIRNFFARQSTTSNETACKKNPIEVNSNETQEAKSNITPPETQVGTRRWAKAAAGAILAMSPIAYQLNTQPPEGSGIEVHQDSFIKETIEITSLYII